MADDFVTKAFSDAVGEDALSWDEFKDLLDNEFENRIEFFAEVAFEVAGLEEDGLDALNPDEWAKFALAYAEVAFFFGYKIGKIRK